MSDPHQCRHDLGRGTEGIQGYLATDSGMGKTHALCEGLQLVSEQHEEPLSCVVDISFQ